MRFIGKVIQIHTQAEDLLVADIVVDAHLAEGVILAAVRVAEVAKDAVVDAKGVVVDVADVQINALVALVGAVEVVHRVHQKVVVEVLLAEAAQEGVAEGVTGVVVVPLHVLGIVHPLVLGVLDVVLHAVPGVPGDVKPLALQFARMSAQPGVVPGVPGDVKPLALLFARTHAKRDAEILARAAAILALLFVKTRVKQDAVTSVKLFVKTRVKQDAVTSVKLFVKTRVKQDAVPHARILAKADVTAAQEPV